MRKSVWIAMALMLVVPGLLLTTSCAKKAMNKNGSTMSSEDDAAKKAAEKARLAELERQKQLEQQRLEEERLKAEQMKKSAMEQFENVHVHFSYDSSVLNDMAQDLLKDKAEWLRNNPGKKALIEGHCDERGTVAYNLALGDRRAESAKRFLISLGIDGSRLSTVSYGEENPISTGGGEAAWAKDRRAQFVIK
jgi:peptidoglycan-associated lipoprotein